MEETDCHTVVVLLKLTVFFGVKSAIDQFIEGLDEVRFTHAVCVCVRMCVCTRARV